MDSLLIDPQTRIATPLPLEFQTPAGWPTPSPDWRASNQGWVPPQGWAPLSGVEPAPAEWQWWRKNDEAWSEFMHREHPGSRLDAAVTMIVAAVGIFGFAFATESHSGLAVLFAGLAVFGPLNVARLGARAMTAEARALRRLRSRSARLGWALARLAYEAGRGSAASDEETFDTFVAERERAAWSFDGTWAADQWHPDLRQIFERYCRGAQQQFHRVGTAALAGVSGGMLLITVLMMLAHHVGGSGSR